MKTLPAEQDYHDTETQKDTITEPRIWEGLKLVGKHNNQSYARTNTDNDCQNSSESDTLIICNPELASSFQTLKSEKHKLNPGHYLQKVFLNSVAQKFRSQSLPNCFEKRKHNKNPTGDTIDEITETSEPLVESVDTVFVNDEVKDSLTEGWFKTWPERGVDKISNLSESVLCEKKVCGDVEYGKINVLTNDTRPGCDKFKCLTTLQHNKKDFLVSSNLETDAKINKFSNESHSLKKTDPVSRTNVSETFGETSCNLELGLGLDTFNCPSGYPNQTNSKSIPLDELLDNFPLAYSPVTRQLLLIKSDLEKRGNPIYFDSNICHDKSTTRKVGEEYFNLEELDIEKSEGGKVCAGNSRGSEHDLSGHNLHRVNTEVSSFSSTVSSLSDNSPSTNEDSALGSLLDHGDTCSLVSIGGCSAFSEDSVGTKNRKKSLTGFLSRNVFNWKSASKSEDSIGRWRLFGKNTSPLSSQSSLTVDHYAESDGGSLAPDSPCSVRSSSSGPRVFSHETRVASSSALIQLDRPANLPAKSEEEEARHRLEYQQILDAAKKKELKEVKLRKKQLQLQLKAEEQLAQAIRVWTQEILPRWEHTHTSKKARELWWQGVPPCVRGKVWHLAIGNPLNLTQSLYNVYVQRARERLRGGGASSDDEDSDNKEASMQLIQLDISRTFPHLCIFQRGGPYYDMLHCLLAAYVCYRPDVGYVQGMSFIAAVLILNMEAADAFVCFANLLDRPCHRAFFHLNQPLMQSYYSTYNQLFKENLPQLYIHFTHTTLTPDLYLLDWIYTVFTKAMNLDLACRVWDVFLRDGEQFLFRTALGVLHMCQDVLLQMDFVHGSQFLTRLPDDLSADQLFKSISCIRMTVGKQTFEDILVLHSAEQ